ncbi:hypothetical protein Salat_0856300 [Sesamum alatum]|uniref:Uncharacterized protein n=1 Tax=Sesamum alatum TaxID=300844 RepID=A0AAE1YJ37_9LAMI|nr:hypothetical protein Salat_0856300 [Sesamum alatum]
MGGREAPTVAVPAPGRGALAQREAKTRPSAIFPVVIIRAGGEGVPRPAKEEDGRGERRRAWRKREGRARRRRGGGDGAARIVTKMAAVHSDEDGDGGEGAPMGWGRWCRWGGGRWWGGGKKIFF